MPVETALTLLLANLCVPRVKSETACDPTGL